MGILSSSQGINWNFFLDFNWLFNVFEKTLKKASSSCAYEINILIDGLSIYLKILIFLRNKFSSESYKHYNYRKYHKTGMYKNEACGRQKSFYQGSNNHIFNPPQTLITCPVI